MPKEIRHNVPSHADKAAFGDMGGHTLHVGGVTMYFDTIREERTGYMFEHEGVDVAYASKDECDVSPVVAKGFADENPNEKIRFADAPDA